MSEQLEDMPARKITNAYQLFHSLFLTMMQAHDTRYISKREAENIIFIPVNDINGSQLSLSDEDKQALIQLGNDRAKQFLKNWP